MAVPLENDPRNPCVGCGPEHASGLRLAFERSPSGASARFVATDQMQGWPGRLHSALLYLAMVETANWTVYALLGRVGLPTRTSALGTTRWVAVGESLTISGSRRDEGGEEPLVAVEARDAQGRVVATLERAYALPDRATFLARMGYETVPPGLEDVLPE